MRTTIRNLTAQKKSTEKSDERSLVDVPEQKVSILLVDDRAENLLALEAVLSSPKYHLVCAHSGEEALKYVLKQDFAAILLDVQMPGLNGFETAKLIKAREKSRHIPILFITAISQEAEHVFHGYSVGAIDYIFKPFQPEALQKKVEEFVRIYQNHERMLLKGERELEEVHQKLDRVTFDLRKSEALARVISETLKDTIVTFDEQGYVLSANDAVESMFGYSAEELIGELFNTLLPELKQENPCLLASNLIETIAVRRNNSMFPVEAQLGDASIEEQTIYVCSIRDITERKQLEEGRKQKLRNDLYLSQERFRIIFESSPCLISILSLEDGRYMDVNPGWLEITGYEYDEVAGKAFDILPMTAASDEEATEGDSLDLRRPVHNVKISYVTKSDEKREGLLSTKILDIEGETCVLCFITDITERVRLENEMIRLDRLNLIGEMAAGIAHEIRNPMTTVRGFLQLSNHSPQNPLQYIDLMLNELDRANAIITEFLTLAKNKVNDKQVQDLNAIIESLFPLIQAEALLSDKYISLELGECTHFAMDEKEIRQMILNLALNGLEAMTAGGRLSIKTHTEQQRVVLEIHDEGTGIKPELIQKIGTPFFTTKETGTGLGLAICYSVADRHHAEIEVKTDHTGTIFFVRFKM
ncbi:PAS domain S-box protein [Brevibacillus reuszeri]|uniref:PAS domain S-box protein n=1 Tax=Brevibacillus reuszeri TaxID=54915 RepID=UPI000A042E40|nr:PAS domain S-box protein [Brevibacillus reuszeri]MED1855282.1 PAS domain S-box protein [Brevibacillus reuszeri]